MSDLPDEHDGDEPEPWVMDVDPATLGGFLRFAADWDGQAVSRAA